MKEVMRRLRHYHSFFIYLFYQFLLFIMNPIDFEINILSIANTYCFLNIKL